MGRAIPGGQQRGHRTPREVAGKRRRVFGFSGDITEPAWQRNLRVAFAAFTERFGREPALLDWDSGLDLAALFPAHSVFSPPVASSTLAYLDGSIDVCVCRNVSARVAEARRVASAMVLKVGRPRKNASASGLAASF